MPGPVSEMLISTKSPRFERAVVTSARTKPGRACRGRGNPLTTLSLTYEVERALRYAFGLPLSTVIVGMESMQQLEQNLAIAESFTPMSDEERLAFFQDIIPLVKPENMRWKATDWVDPKEWISRNRGR